MQSCCNFDGPPLVDCCIYLIIATRRWLVLYLPYYLLDVGVVIGWLLHRLSLSWVDPCICCINYCSPSWVECWMLIAAVGWLLYLLLYLGIGGWLLCVASQVLHTHHPNATTTAMASSLHWYFNDGKDGINWHCRSSPVPRWWLPMVDCCVLGITARHERGLIVASFNFSTVHVRRY